MHALYTGKILPGYFAKYATVIRCMVSKIASGDKGQPFLRTLVFNLARQFFPMLWTPVLVDFLQINNFLKIVRTVATQVLVITLVFHFIPRSWIKRLRYLEVYALLEFLASFPFGFVNLMNSIHTSVLIKGDLIVGALIVIVWAHNRLGINYLEDLMFWDMNTFSVKGIPGNYFPYLMAVPFLYWANINLLNSDL